MKQIDSGKGLHWIAMFWYLLLLTINYSCKDWWNGFYQITMPTIIGKTIDFVKEEKKNKSLDCSHL